MSANVEEETFSNYGLSEHEFEHFEVVKHEPVLERNDDDLHQRKAISVDQDFVDNLYDQDFEIVDDEVVDETQSPQSLKKIAAAAVQNDSGYIGCESSKKTEQSELLDDFDMDMEENDSPILTSKDLGADIEVESTELRCFASLLDRIASSFSLTSYVEMLMMIVVVSSSLFMIFIGDKNEGGTMLSGKKAAIQFYYDSLNKEQILN